MTLRKNGYVDRIIDDEVEELLKISGAVNITGPKWCGKTWVAFNHANSAVMMDDSTSDYQNRRLALIDPKLILKGDSPVLIDEWQEVPKIWDAVRRDIDDSIDNGRFILTGSTTPNRTGISHTGMGRICEVSMHTMSLFEMGRSDGKVSLKKLFDGEQNNEKTRDADLQSIIDISIHGGWPRTMSMDTKSSLKLVRGYIDSFLNYGISYDGISRNKETMRRLIRSIARNESTVATKKTLMKDMKESPDDADISPITLNSYLHVLTDQFMVEWQPAFSPENRSSIRVGKTPKRHLSDPSLTVAAMNWTSETMLNDLNTFGFVFESLCEHDLRIYAESLGGKLYHYRDSNNDEIDAVVELPGNRLGAFEIKLGAHQIDDAAKELLKMKDRFSKNFTVAPELLCVICGMTSFAYRRDDGVYVVPITSLRN